MLSLKATVSITYLHPLLLTSSLAPRVQARLRGLRALNDWKVRNMCLEHASGTRGILERKNSQNNLRNSQYLKMKLKYRFSFSAEITRDSQTTTMKICSDCNHKPQFSVSYAGITLLPRSGTPVPFNRIISKILNTLVVSVLRADYLYAHH